MSLLPNSFPKDAFENAQSLAPEFNILVDRISRDRDFLHRVLGGAVAAADPFTAKLLDLYEKLYDHPHATQADRLGIHRSDYMLNDGSIKQIELNTIAASFAGLSSRVASLHRYLCGRYPSVPAFFDKSGSVPENPTLERLPAAFAVAVQRYQERFDTSNCGVLFVVQEGETNTVDQRLLEFHILSATAFPSFVDPSPNSTPS